ncbi:MAG TPA: ribulose 1,5-bisphosphate carboxylase large subunit [Caldilineae bacterium]|nr:ribulose 1,5-bisphosphate carboxylase large subunit [Caldilineae bacterium]
MIFPHTELSLSGERFTVHYRLVAADEVAAREKAYGICLEQTVEVPDILLAEDDIRAQVMGRIESLVGAEAGRYDVVISYAIETTAFEFTQLLNVVFGNSAMQPGIRVLHLDLPNSLLQHFQGPRFGQQGLRDLVGVSKRPLLCTALKPMGLSAANLAELAYLLALGGIDIIKEDHGLSDQPFARFHDRVGRGAEAIAAANRQTGLNCLYVPNITAPFDQIVQRAHEAKKLGAGGVMVAPGLVGWDAMRLLAEDEGLALPIFSHPAWLGSFTSGWDHGLSHHVIFGQLPRLAGADATIFVNYGGRFDFSQEDCRGIVDASERPLARLKPIMPVPAGGMTLERLPELYDFYGVQAIFLIAGGLYAQGPDLLANARQFRHAVETLGH